MVSSEGQKKTNPNSPSTVIPDLGHFGERKTRRMAEDIEAGGSKSHRTEAVSPFSVFCLPGREMRKTVTYVKPKECQSLDFGFPFPGGQQRMVELTQKSKSLSKQSLSSQLSLFLHWVCPNQDLWRSHVVLRMTSAPAASGSSPFPKVAQPLSRPFV